MTSRPENAFKVVHLPANVKKALTTDHRYVTDHHHLPTTIHDVILVRIIIAEITTDHRHRSVTMVKIT